MWPLLYPQPPPPTLNEGDGRGLPGEVRRSDSSYAGKLFSEGQLLLVLYQTREVALLRESLWNQVTGPAKIWTAGI